MLLTDIVVRQLNQAGRYTDDQTKGLHLWIKASNQKYWIFRYTINGNRQNMSLGSYPEISLKQARQKAIKARKKRSLKLKIRLLRTRFYLKTSH
jgi:hypothetical protein